MHANTLCGIFGISETDLPLIPKSASEPTRHLFTSADTFQNTKTQNYFPDLFQQNWEENQGCSAPHSRISTATPALLSKQTSAWRGRATRAPWLLSASAGVRSLLCQGEQKGTPPGWHHMLPGFSCVKPDFQGQLEGCWKNTKLVTLISSLQRSVHHPPLAQFSADNFQPASTVHYCFCTYTVKSCFKAAQLSWHQIYVRKCQR